MGQISTFYPNPGPSQAEKFCKEEIRMRNLKRALSLTLASVMLLGMMVIGTSAAAGYDDVKETDNVEAIEVLQAVEVMVGDDRGFGPDRPVTRAEMAVVMGKLLNLDYNYYVSTCPFADVSGNFDWAKGWVGACAANGIVSGRGDGIYDPAATVTAVEAASMMMRALGYFRYQNDYADGFMVSTVRLGTKIGLFEGVGTDAATPMTRNQVAQMALNALRSGMVEPDGNTINLTTPDGSVFTGKVNYVFVTSAKPYATAISPIQATAVGSQNGGPIVELGEQLYNGKLTLVEDNVGGQDVKDEFGRPSRHWEYDGKKIGTYAKVEDLRQEYTDEVTGKMLYELLGKDVIASYDIDITIDGEVAYNVLNNHGYFSAASMIRTNTDAVGATGKGVLTQVFVDGENKTIDIAIINTYLAKARSDYNTRDNDVDLTVFKINDNAVTNHYVKAIDTDPNNTEIMTVEGEDFEIEDVKDGDLFLVTVAEGEIQSMVKPEVLSETTINAFKTKSWVRSDNNQYDYATTAQYDEEVLDMYSNTNMKDVTYNIILDKYGYLIGLELNEQPNQYLFLAGLDQGSSNISAQNARANVIFLDGTMATVTVDTANSEAAATATASDGSTTGYTITGGDDDFTNIAVDVDHLGQANTWCTYTVNGDGIYTLKQVGNFAGAATATPSVRGAKKVAQSTMDANVMLAASGDTPTNKAVVINSKNVALEGSKKRNDRINGDFEYVYGDEKTVYINVDMKDVVNKDGTTRAIIDKVSSSSVGVKNVDITVKDLSTHSPALTNAPTAEVYVLYNNKGGVISAVTLAAEDNGTSSSWAYITSGVNQEEYLGGSDWRWTKDAIIDGKAVKLTEKRDDYKYLKDTVTAVGNWYEVRFDAEGNVNGIKENDGLTAGSDDRAALGISNRIIFDFVDDKFITDVQDVRLATNGITPYTKANDSLLLFSNFTCSSHNGAPNAVANLRFERERGTLYTDTGTSKGFTVDPNVKVVLTLSDKHGSDPFGKVVDTYEGWDGLEDALKALDCEQSAFDGFLGAVFANGRATSIILDDRSGSHTGVVEGAPLMTVNVTLMGPNGTLGTQTIRWDGTPFDGSEVTNPDGYTFASASRLTFVENGTGNVTFTYTKDEGDVPSKTGYISVQFTVSGPVDLGSPITVPVKVDPLGKGTLTAEDLKKYIPAGYKLTSAFAPVAVTDQTGASTITDTDVMVEELPVTDVSAIAVHGDDVATWTKYGTAISAVSVGGESITFDLTYPNGIRNVPANFTGITYETTTSAGTTNWTKDGDSVVTFNGKTCNLPVKIYADVATTVTAGTDLADWDITVPASTTTKSGKVTLTFTQKTGSEDNFTATEMAALVAKLVNDGTADLTVGGFSNASLTTAGKAETSVGAGDGVKAVFTVEVAVSAPGAATVTLKVDAPTVP